MVTTASKTLNLSEEDVMWAQHALNRLALKQSTDEWLADVIDLYADGKITQDVAAFCENALRDIQQGLAWPGDAFTVDTLLTRLDIQLARQRKAAQD